jgi:hypothetical protein
VIDHVTGAEELLIESNVWLGKFRHAGDEIEISERKVSFLLLTVKSGAGVAVARGCHHG